jgi:intracellular septation protein
MSEELPQTDVIADTAEPKHPAWLPYAIDYGPLLAFFLTFQLTKGDGPFGTTSGVVTATFVFIVTVLIALAVSQWKLKKISPMLWLSAIFIIGFGGITIWLNDERFIVMKPTLIYGLFAAMLLGGWLAGRPLLKFLLQAAYDGLSDEGWMKLSRNWGIFFVMLGVANHVMYEMIYRWDALTVENWITIKTFGVTGISFLFAISQLPLMLRHGLDLGLDEKAAD